MKALVGAFNQEKAPVGAFSVIVQLHRLIDLRHYFTRLCSGCVSVGAEREEELPAGEVPQLAPRPQRVPDHVHHDEDRQDGQVDTSVGNVWPCSSYGRSTVLRII